MERFTKKQPISTLKSGDLVNDIFVVKIKRSVSPYVKGYSVALFLTDASGRSIEYKYWGGRDEGKVRALFSSIKQDSVVLINGKASMYNDKMQITSDEESPPKALNPEEYNASFIMTPKKDVEEMYSMLLSKINSVQDESIKNLLLRTFENDLKDKFKKHPGAIEIHHNWISGLN